MIFYKDIFLAPSENGIIRVPIEHTQHFFDIRNIRIVNRALKGSIVSAGPFMEFPSKPQVSHKSQARRNTC